MTKTIEIVVDPKGGTKVETKGFSGAECRQASEFIEKALGQRTGEQLTTEFHLACDTHRVEQRSR